MMGVSRLTKILVTYLVGATIVITQTAAGEPAAASDSQIDPRVRTFLAERSSPFFWELLPGPQVRAILTGPSGVTIAEKTITEQGSNIKLDTGKPEKADGTLPAFMFFHGGVWLHSVHEIDACSDERQQVCAVEASPSGLRRVEELVGLQEPLRAGAGSPRHALAQPDRRERVRRRSGRSRETGPRGAPVASVPAGGTSPALHPRYVGSGP
jgi:hypothetical protein